MGAVVLPRAMLMARLMRMIRLAGCAILVAMLPDDPGAAVGSRGRAGFVVHRTIPHPAHDRFDRATQEEGGEGKHRRSAAGPGETGQHPSILAEEVARCQPGPRRVGAKNRTGCRFHDSLDDRSDAEALEPRARQGDRLPYSGTSSRDTPLPARSAPRAVATRARKSG